MASDFQAELERYFGPVIATRTIYVVSGGEVIVDLAAPKAGPHGGWVCAFRLSGLDGRDRIRGAIGEDAVQALWIALNMIGSELYASAMAETGQLRLWDRENGSRNLMFPVQDSFSDLVPDGRPVVY